MKLRQFSLFTALLAGPFAALLVSQSAHAGTYYWDTDGSGTPGFGTASGTWGTDAFWGEDADGIGATANTSITTADSIHFGTAAAGLTPGTINGPGTVQGFLNMTFGSASGSIDISGGTLDLNSSTGSTITVNNSSDSISTVLQGTGGKLIKAGTGALTLAGSNTFSGGISFVGSAANNFLVLKKSDSAGTGSINLYGGVGAIKLDNTGTGDNIVFSNTISLMSGNLSAPLFYNVAGDNKITSNLGINTGASNTAIQVDGGTLEISGNWYNSTTNRNVYLQGANNGLYSGNIQFGANNLNKAGAGTWTLSGTNTYTGTTSISGGTLKNGSATTFTNKGALSMSSTGTFDLGGFNASVTNVSASTATNTIINNGSSDATLTISGQANQVINALIKDGATHKLAVNIANTNGSAAFAPGATQNTFSGGLTLTHNATGTRVRINSAITTTGSAGAITSSPFGRGAITIGQAASEKAQILMDTVSNNTLANDIIVNTANGTDFAGSLRIDTTGNVLSGTITANLSHARFAMNTGASATVTGKITGPSGVQVGGSTSIYTGTLTLANSANDYTGPTIVSLGTLKLGVAGSIASSSSLSIAPGAILDTVDQPTFALSASQPVTFQVDGSSSGSSGRISASGINISNAVVAFDIVNPLDDDAYVLASYTSKSGTAFASVTPPAGYRVDYSYNGGTQIALVKSGFSSWIDTNFPTLSDKTAGGDPDNDGMENMLEYVLNGNPGTSDSSILPELDVSGANFVFNFTRREESIGDTTQVFQYGSDLGGWTPLNITAPTAEQVALGPVTSGLQPVTVTIPKILASGGKLFGRLQVVKVP